MSTIHETEDYMRQVTGDRPSKVGFLALAAFAFFAALCVVAVYLTGVL